jgi:hypothetical protein
VHSVHFQKEMFRYFSEIDTSSVKKYEKAFLKLVFTYEDDNFSPILLLKRSETSVHKNI